MSETFNTTYLLFTYNKIDRSAKVLHCSRQKERAIESFSTDAISSLIEIKQKADKIYFIGFDPNTPLYSILEDLLQKYGNVHAPFTNGFTFDDCTRFVDNLDSASCAFCLSTEVPFCSKLKPATSRCSECGKYTNGILQRTIYGEALCNSCWEDYIHSDKGYVEYATGIENGKYSLADFTEEEQELIRSSLDDYTEALNQALISAE